MFPSHDQGGYSAIGALTSGNVQFINQIDSMNASISRSMEKSQQYAGQASMYGAAANLAFQGASMMPSSQSTGQNSLEVGSTQAGYGPQYGFGG